MAHSKLSTLEEWVLLIRAVIFVVRVDGDITIPTSPSERYVKLSPHTAPLYFNPCLWIRVLIVVIVCFMDGLLLYIRSYENIISIPEPVKFI